MFSERYLSVITVEERLEAGRSMRVGDLRRTSQSITAAQNIFRVFVLICVFFLHGNCVRIKLSRADHKINEHLHSREHWSQLFGAVSSACAFVPPPIRTLSQTTASNCKNATWCTCLRLLGTIYLSNYIYILKTKTRINYCLPQSKSPKYRKKSDVAKIGNGLFEKTFRQWY